MGEENATHNNVSKRPTRRTRTRWNDKIRKDIVMRGDNWEKYKKTGSVIIDMAGYFSTIVDIFYYMCMKFI